MEITTAMILFFLVFCSFELLEIKLQFICNLTSFTGNLMSFRKKRPYTYEVSCLRPIPGLVHFDRIFITSKILA